MPPSGLSFRQVQEILKKQNVDNVVINQIKEIWEELDFMRFAASKIDPESVINIALKFRQYIFNWEKFLK